MSSARPRVDCPVAGGIRSSNSAQIARDLREVDRNSPKVVRIPALVVRDLVEDRSPNLP